MNSAYRLFAWGTQPLGALLGGLIGELLDLRAVFLLAGVVGLSLLATRVVITEQALVDAEAVGASSADHETKM